MNYYAGSRIRSGFNPSELSWEWIGTRRGLPRAS
jgi:hypothetical protein